MPVFTYKITVRHETGNNLNDPFYYEWSYSIARVPRSFSLCSGPRFELCLSKKFLFSIPVQTGLAAHPICSALGIGALPRAKAAGNGVEQPPTNRAKVSPSVLVMVWCRALEKQRLLREYWSLCIL